MHICRGASGITSPARGPHTFRDAPCDGSTPDEDKPCNSPSIWGRDYSPWAVVLTGCDRDLHFYFSLELTRLRACIDGFQTSSTWLVVLQKSRAQILTECATHPRIGTHFCPYPFRTSANARAPLMPVPNRREYDVVFIPPLRHLTFH